MMHRCLSAGRILNRFSSDVAVADDSLPFILNILLANVAALAAAAGVLAFTSPLLALCAVPLAAMYRCPQPPSPPPSAVSSRTTSALCRLPVAHLRALVGTKISHQEQGPSEFHMIRHGQYKSEVDRRCSAICEKDCGVGVPAVGS